jgi:hypothetical protein
MAGLCGVLQSPTSQGRKNVAADVCSSKSFIFCGEVIAIDTAYSSLSERYNNEYSSFLFYFAPTLRRDRAETDRRQIELSPRDEF